MRFLPQFPVVSENLERVNVVISGLAKSSQKTLESARDTYSMIEKLEENIQESNTAVADTVSLATSNGKCPDSRRESCCVPDSNETSESDDSQDCGDCQTDAAVELNASIEAARAGDAGGASR